MSEITPNTKETLHPHRSPVAPDRRFMNFTNIYVMLSPELWTQIAHLRARQDDLSFLVSILLLINISPGICYCYEVMSVSNCPIVAAHLGIGFLTALHIK